jgi:hypothetical protein
MSVADSLTTWATASRVPIDLSRSTGYALRLVTSVTLMI